MNAPVELDPIPELRRYLEQHVKNRMMATSVTPSDSIQDASKDFAKRQKEYSQATQKVSDWLSDRAKRISRFPKNLFSGTKAIRDLSVKLADHLKKSSKASQSMSTTIDRLLQVTSLFGQKADSLEKRVQKLEMDRTNLLLGMSKELKAVRVQVAELRKASAAPNDHAR